MKKAKKQRYYHGMYRAIGIQFVAVLASSKKEAAKKIKEHECEPIDFQIDRNLWSTLDIVDTDEDFKEE